VPSSTLDIDSQRFAELNEQGWVHVSGETALALNGDTFELRSQYFPIRDVVSCDSEDRCSADSLSVNVVIEGSTVFIEGVERGMLNNADTAQRMSAIIALSLYQPPGGVWAKESSHNASISIAALPDGRLVQGERCGWPDRCIALQQTGTWTTEEIELRGTKLRIEDVWDQNSERLIVLATPTDVGPTILLPTSPQPFRAGSRLTWATRTLQLDFFRETDVKLDSEITRAALVALAMELKATSDAIPPPPPPPPRR
jgi:hypothetical protein